NLEDLSGAIPHLRGIRIPQLARYLAANVPGEDWFFELRLLRSQLFAVPTRGAKEERPFLSALQDNPEDTATWGAYSDWLEERGEQRAGLLLLRRALERAAHYPVFPVAEQVDWTEVGKGSVAESRKEFQRLAKELKVKPTHKPT